MNCPEYESEQIVKNGKIKLQDQTPIQKYLCNACGKQFNERTGTPMVRLRTPAMVVSLALSMRTEGMGVRATGRSFGINPVVKDTVFNHSQHRQLHHA